MNKIIALILAAAIVPAVPVHAGPGGAQEKARREARAGNVLSLPTIERMVVSQYAGAQYIGPEYDEVARVYRLKFIQDGHVIYVDVDARTGQKLRELR